MPTVTPLGRPIDKQSDTGTITIATRDACIAAPVSAARATYRMDDYPYNESTETTRIALAGMLNAGNARNGATARHVKIIGETLEVDGKVDSTLDRLWIDAKYRTLWVAPSDLVNTATFGSIDAALRIRGAQVNLVTAGGLPAGLTASNWTAGQSSIQFTTAPSALATALISGSYIYITTTENHNPNRTDQSYKGEIIEVLSVGAASGTTTITFKGALQDSYDTTKITKLWVITPVRGVKIDGLRINANDTYTASSTQPQQQLFTALWAKNIRVADMELGGGALYTPRYGAQFLTCIAPKVKNFRAFNMADSPNSVSGQLGIGMEVSGGFGGEFQDVRAEHTVHCLDFSCLGAGDTSPGYGVPRHHRVINGIATNTFRSPWSVHNGDGIILDSPVAENCGGGIIVRGPNTTLINPVVRGVSRQIAPGQSTTQGYNHAIYIGEPDKSGTSFGGLGGTGIRIYNPDIDMRNSGGVTGDAIYWCDPAIDSVVQCVLPLLPTGSGFNFVADTMDRCTFDIVVDGSAQNASSTSNHNGAAISTPGASTNPATSSTTAVRSLTNSKVTVRAANSLTRGRLLYVDGGGGTGVADNLRLTAIHPASDGTVALVEYGAGGHGGSLVEFDTPAVADVTTLVVSKPIGANIVAPGVPLRGLTQLSGARTAAFTAKPNEYCRVSLAAGSVVATLPFATGRCRVLFRITAAATGNALSFAVQSGDAFTITAPTLTALDQIVVLESAGGATGGLWNVVGTYNPPAYLKSVVRPTILKVGTAAITPSATAATNGTAVNVTPDAGNVGINLQTLTWKLTAGVSGENVTATFTATFDDASTQALSFTAIAGNVTAVQTATANQLYNLVKDGRYITQIACQFQSTIASSTATGTASISGTNIP